MNTDIQQQSVGKTPVDTRAILIMIAVILGTASNQIAWNIVGVALPRMQGAYSATPDQISWVMSSFVLGNTLMFIVTGWLAARFGRRRVFLASIICFTMTLVTCATASSLEEQVFWRFIQGLASAALIPLGHVIVTDAYPRERFGEATALWSIGLVASGAAAPLMGAYLIDNFGWQSIYYFTLPLGVISLVASWKFVPESNADEARRMDWVGVAGMLAMVMAVHLILNRGSRLDWLESPEIVIELIVATVGLYVFAYQTFTSKHPFLPLPLLRDINFLLGTFLSFFHGALVMLSLVILPLLLEGLIGYTVMDTGMLILPRGFGIILGMFINTKLADRIDPRMALIIGLIAIAVSSHNMSMWSLDIDPESVAVTNFVLGLGSGISFVPLTMLAFSTVSKEHENEAFAIFYLVYYTGVASGIAIVLAIVSHYSQVNYAELTQNITPYNKTLQFLLSSDIGDIGETTSLARISAEITRQSNMIAYNNSFRLSMICALAAIPLVLMFRRKV